MAWDCACGDSYETMAEWSRCYRSHPRKDGRIKVDRRTMKRESAPLFRHPDGATRNFPADGAGLETLV